MRVPFINLREVNREIETEIYSAVHKVIESGRYIFGNEVEDFENELKKTLVADKMGYAISCNSGTDALVLALRASGIGTGDEVITVSNTAIPTISAICSIGARPVFIDIDPETWMLDINQIINYLTPNVKAIIPVHLYGNMVDIFRIREILKAVDREDIAIIEDVAQAHGSKLYDNYAGTIGDFGAFSFYPTKNIGALGDSGAVYCSNKNKMEHVKMFRNYGQKDRYFAELTGGINSRMDEMQAAILKIKLKYLDKWNKKKHEIVERYKVELSNLPVAFQKVTNGCKPGWHLCVIKLENEEIRNKLMSYLQDKEIGTLIHYPYPAHKQKAFQVYVSSTSCSDKHLLVTEKFASSILSIPMNIALTEEQQTYIIDSIQSFYR